MIPLHILPLTRWLLLLAVLWPSASQVEAIERNRLPQIKMDLPKPTFRIDPLRFETQAIPGREVSFSFRLHAVTDSVHLQVTPVGLRQEATGLIVPDQGVEPQGTIRLHGSPTCRLKPGETNRIRGRWQIPADAGALTVAGLLVTQLPEARQQGSSKHRAGASVQFVSRYLLRLEAETLSRSKTEPLEVQHAKLFESKGLAQVSATLIASESRQARVWARILDAQKRPLGQAFSLGLPVRANMHGPEKWRVGLIAGGQVHVQARSPQPLFPGQYHLQVTTADDRGGRRRTLFPVEVPAGAYPAQQAMVDSKFIGLKVAPRNIELSLASGGARLAPLRLRNDGAETVTVELATHAINTEQQALRNTHQHRSTPHAPATCVDVRPARVVLKPGQRRNVMVAYRPQGNRFSLPRYAMIEAQISSGESTKRGKIEVPVGVLPSTELPAPEFACNQDEDVSKDGNRRLVFTVANQGRTHLEPHAILTWLDAEGMEHQTERGYRQWLLPGEARHLVFNVPGPPHSTVETLSVSPTRTASDRLLKLSE